MRGQTTLFTDTEKENFQLQPTGFLAPDALGESFLPDTY